MRQRILVLGAASSISLMLGLNLIALATIGPSAHADSRVFTLGVPVPPLDPPSVPPLSVSTMARSVASLPISLPKQPLPTTSRVTPAIVRPVVTATIEAATAGPPVTLGGIWACIRRLESGGNYAANTGNGYFGAYQFLPGTWNSAVSGAGYPQYANGRANLAPPAVQDAAAVWLQAHSGWAQWSTASRCGA
jgi:hypothetical protein